MFCIIINSTGGQFDIFKAPLVMKLDLTSSLDCLFQLSLTATYVRAYVVPERPSVVRVTKLLTIIPLSHPGLLQFKEEFGSLNG